MVAAGTGAITPISLWLFSEGRYEPTNFPSFTIDPATLTWNWDTSSSDYKQVREEEFAKTDGKAWHIESAEPFSAWQLDPLRWVAESDPVASGYADDMGQGAVEACDADIAALVEGINESSLWVSKLHAELPRSALAQDLVLGASMDQSVLWHTLQLTKTTGTPPACPTFPPCGGNSSGGSNNPWEGFWGEDPSSASGGGGGCAVGGDTGLSATMGLLGLSAALTYVRRRRRRS
jgi:MYXO-CTERM domain-containing protein